MVFLNLSLNLNLNRNMSPLAVNNILLRLTGNLILTP